ncbi:serine hydrolase [Sphaerisporangium sp. NBC_01403]|uniref:D-alanyl-D-alanine carboxypeptidase family protein n=1 Tax=Sphaerisporangium sp. NBC_01403 TaxID=2903599 RepID=UPI0032565A51
MNRPLVEVPAMCSARHDVVRSVLWACALALMVTGVSGCVGSARSDVRAAPPRPVIDLSLPWPSEGQAGIEVVGVGGLGTSGQMRPVPIASVTKVMTAHVILRDHPLKDGEAGPLIEVDRTAATESLSGRESTAPVREGQRLSLRRSLELMLIPSGNNVARLLARWDAGSQEAFVAKMNAAAAGLGMADTVYTGASGNEDSTVSTAVDQLKLARQVMKDEVFRQVVAMTETTVPGDPSVLRNTNTLLDRPGVIGVKTGSGTAAGGNLMWAVKAEMDGRTRLVLGVVLAQSPGTNPTAGKYAALDAGDRLITAVRKELASR